MVLTRSRQSKDTKSVDDKPQEASKKVEDLVAQNTSLKTRRAKPKQTSAAASTTTAAKEEVVKQQQPVSTVQVPKPDPVKDAVVIETTGDETPKKKKKRNRKRKSAEKKQTEEISKDAPSSSVTNSTTKGEASSSSSSSGKQKSNNNASSTKETVIPTKSAKKAKIVKEDERTAVVSVDEELQKENVSASSTLDLENEQPLIEKMEVISAKEIMKLYKKESFIGEVTKHKGVSKSGRKWKTEQTSRSNGMKQDKPMKTSWKKKMSQKAETKSMKLFEAELKDAKTKENERKKQHRAKKLKLKLENERKSEVVQVIKNTSKIKRMKKKQLRTVEMRKIPNFNTAQIFA
ncbi:coiled-coil domain-containing protein 86-like [Asterias rubens]|uniref:coiled-coil domain-containing protein 86-like n=1 Tax=Asterias rubens TaxID=7604 RepID=UPI0014556B06|nr:coiled-coil domain-containing protein 86-like [Asterias rubens]